MSERQTDRHKHNPIPFRPPEGDREWLMQRSRATAQPVNAILAQALAEYRARIEMDDPTQEEER